MLIIKIIMEAESTLSKIHNFFCRPRNYNWYLNLNKPKIVPPAEIISIVWTILYIMNALSLYFYLKANNFSFDDGILFFCIQIFGNVIYTHLFFRWKMIQAALADCIIILLCTILATQYFYEKSQLAA